MRPSAAVWLALLSAACTSRVDPDQGRFSCTEDAHCGDGYECRPQQGREKGLCYPIGACAEETCNGQDDDCDGLIDETFPEQLEPCTAALPGVCSAGRRVCVDGQLACASAFDAGPELCDSLDNDCDGQADEDFDLTSSDAHCGACNRPCGAGASCRDSTCRETACDDESDNDGDGTADCLDEDCFGQTCGPADAWMNCGRGPDAGFDGGLDGGLDGGGGGAPDGGDVGEDGGADAGFDGGSDGGPDAASSGCFSRESVCDDGWDSDGDGFTDCADVDCDGKRCGQGDRICNNRVCPP